MNKVYDAIVIGAGLIGSSAAKYLQQNGYSVALVGPPEPASDIAGKQQQVFGSYYDQARITRQLGWDPVWCELDSRSLNRFRAIEGLSGVKFFFERGSLVVMAGSIASRTNSMFSHSSSQGIQVEKLSKSQLEKMLPYFKSPMLEGGVDALFERERAGYINPRKLVGAQLELFRKAGGHLFQKTVTCVNKSKSLVDHWQVNFVHDGEGGTLNAKKILVATGAFANTGSVLGADRKLDMAVFTEPNLLYEIDIEDQKAMADMPPIVIVDPANTGIDNTSIYLLPPIEYPDGKYYLRIGPGMQPIVKQLTSLEAMREWYIEQKITPDQKLFLNSMLGSLLPSIRPVSVQESCCIVEKTLSKYPYIGEIDGCGNLYVAVGGNGHGARGSDELGRLAAVVLREAAWDSPIDRAVFKPKVTSESRLNKSLTFTPPFGLC